MINAAILTISDSCSSKTRQDISGPTIDKILRDAGFETCHYEIIPDECRLISEKLKTIAEEKKPNLIFTTGGTGLGPRDVTPQATDAVCEKTVPGLAELVRAEGLKKTKNAALSRGTAGIFKNTLIINLPGSPKAVKESLQAILDILPHAIKMMAGGGH